VVDKPTKQRARFERLASSEYFARRDVRLLKREGRLQHGGFPPRPVFERCALTRIMLFPSRSFKAALGLAANAGQGEDFFCRATGAAQQWLVRRQVARMSAAKIGKDLWT